MLDLAKVPPDLLPVALESNLRRLGPSYKLAGHLVEAVRLRLAADAAWMLPDLDVPATGERRAIVRGDEALYDAVLVDAFLARRRPAIPATTVLARVIRHGRQVALVGAVRGERPFGPADRRAVDRLCAVLALELERRERKRLYRVLDRIKEKVVAELRPRDLAYQILDGLHQLVDYDHSSAFLTWDAEAGVLRVEAEKIVWTKAKSAAVGREIPVPPEAIETLQRGLRHGDRAPAAEGEPEWAAVRRLGRAGGRALPAGRRGRDPQRAVEPVARKPGRPGGGQGEPGDARAGGRARRQQRRRRDPAAR